MATIKALPKKYWVLGTVLLLMLILHVAVPPLIKSRINKHLGSFSPLYAIHIGDMDLNFFRMAYAFHDVKGSLKKDGATFATIKTVDVSLAWREILSGRFVTDVDITAAQMKLTTAVFKALASQDKDKYEKDAKDVKDSTVPFDLERLRLIDSRFHFAELDGLPAEQSFRLTGIEASAYNLTPKDDSSLSLFVATGTVQETAKIKAVGHARLKRQPPDWSANVEMRDFQLKSINALTRRQIRGIL